MEHEVTGGLLILKFVSHLCTRSKCFKGSPRMGFLNSSYDDLERP
jgi:hypothetical protein